MPKPSHSPLRWGTDGRRAVVVGGAYVAVALVVWALGFLAISDDDYARISIAQAFAGEPKLDPTGSSWLPFPFWFLGAAMLVFGKSFAVARAHALVQALLSGSLLYVGGRLAGHGEKVASLGALIPLLIPLVGLTAAAALPELFTAALLAFALLALAGRSPQRWLLSGAALGIACLSRYEAWPVALAAAVYGSISSVRGKASPKPLGLVLLPLLAMGGWVAWNQHAHGHPLHFLQRVTNYRAAFIGGLPTIAEVLTAYPGALVRHAPGHWVVLGMLLWRLPRGRKLFHPLPWAGCALLLFCLVAASARGGAPTHHLGRPVLALMLLTGPELAHGLTQAAEAFPRFQRKAQLAILAAGITFTISRGRRVPWYLGVSRKPELALAARLRDKVPAGKRLLVVAKNYGFFALKVGLARPGELTAALPQKIDPRSKIRDPFEESEAVSAIAHKQQAEFLLCMSPLGYRLPDHWKRVGTWGKATLYCRKIQGK